LDGFYYTEVKVDTPTLLTARNQGKSLPGAVAHACNPSYQEAEIRRIVVQSQPGQIILETLLSPK
jgi:hypothetical protein